MTRTLLVRGFGVPLVALEVQNIINAALQATAATGNGGLGFTLIWSRWQRGGGPVMRPAGFEPATKRL